MSMTLIQHIELGSAQASITFSSIPATFTDLVVVTCLRGNQFGGITLNSNNSNTSMRVLWGTGSSVSSASYTSFTYNIWQTVAKSGSTASTFGNANIYIPNYLSSAAKSISIDSVSENNGTAAEQIISAALWNNTAAITSIALTSLDANLNANGTFAQYSSATLYGITAGSSGGVTIS